MPENQSAYHLFFEAMKINEKIKERREHLGLSDTDIVERTNISIYEFGDIEAYPDELITVTYLKEVKELCVILKFDVFELFGISSHYPLKSEKETNHINYTLPRQKLIKKKREELKLSQEELGDNIGFNIIAIEEMEKDEEFLEKWTMELIIKLAKELKLPLNSLIIWNSK